MECVKLDPNQVNVREKARMNSNESFVFTETSYLYLFAFACLIWI